MLLLFSESGTAKAEIRVEYPPVQDPQHEQTRQAIIQGHMLENWANKINPLLKQPVNLTVVMRECGVKNATYIAPLHQIWMCYEMWDEVVRLVQKGVTADQVNARVLGAWTFIFYHELGHALTDIFDLPVVGKEEDAVDQFATLFVAENREPGREEIAESGALVFWWLVPLTPENTGIGFADYFRVVASQSAYADEHGLGQQRFYNIVCLLYGNNPQRYKGYFVPNQMMRIDPQRQPFCKNEYAKVRRRWGTLTKDYFKW